MHGRYVLLCQFSPSYASTDVWVQMWETGLIDAISMKVYEAMAYHVTQANFHRRVKAVGAWSLQMTASALMSTLRMLMDPMTAHLRDVYEHGAESALFQVPTHDSHPPAPASHGQHQHD